MYFRWPQSCSRWPGSRQVSRSLTSVPETASIAEEPESETVTLAVRPAGGWMDRWVTELEFHRSGILHAAISRTVNALAFSFHIYNFIRVMLEYILAECVFHLIPRMHLHYIRSHKCILFSLLCNYWSHCFDLIWLKYSL